MKNKPFVIEREIPISSAASAYSESSCHSFQSSRALLKNNIEIPADVIVDPYDLPGLQDDPTTVAWSDLSCGGKLKRMLGLLANLGAILGLLFVFVCSLDIMSDAFRLLGGKTAGSVFSEESVLANPVAGLMTGVLATVLVQSSSTSTSIIVTMVASGILPVRTGVPIIMGANIGTSVTNTLVAMGQINCKDEFRRAFAGATVHDMFNWLTVFILLPTEVMTHYLEWLSFKLVEGLKLKPSQDENAYGGLEALTDPITSRIVKVDKTVITRIGMGDEAALSDPLLQKWCNETIEGRRWNTSDMNATFWEYTTYAPETRFYCSALMNQIGLADMTTGVILLIASLLLLCGVLIVLVKILQGLFRGHIAGVIRKTVNSDFPGPFSILTGYAALLVGAVMTMLVQSSSIFTSTLTPLVGIGVIRLERVYPLTLGSNIGTTVTGILAALAAEPVKLKIALQMAFCHLLFNVSGILIWYPLPFLRKIPINLAKKLGDTTADYRWFAMFYLLMMFVALPAAVFSLSLAGKMFMICIGGPIICCLTLVIIINWLQKSPDFSSNLPAFLKTWNFLPLFMHSLQPWDSLFRSCAKAIKNMLCCGRADREILRNSASFSTNV